jgi:site-specific DNA-methyltransferase (adenine-specific)
MEILYKAMGELKPYENNPRNNDGAVDAVAASIKEFGFKVPIVIDKDNVIIAGHTRYKASEKLGLDKVPCIVADDLTEQQIKAYRLADNKVGELADWDFGTLEMELEGIDEIDMEQFGFEPLVAEDAEIVEDEVPEIPEEAKSQEGDLWILGKHRLICGDSTDATVIERLMNGYKANMVLTDPPYGVTYTGGMKIDDGKIKSNNKKQIKNDALDYENLYQFL